MVGFKRAVEEVRDGYLGDLPEDIRIQLMNIHKLIVAECNEAIKKSKYDDIRDTAWAKTMLEEFLTVPSDKNHVGSVRLYKKGKRFRCMIQMSGHVSNNRNDADHEMFHDFIKSVHTALRTQIRRKYDMTITSEGDHGEAFEGFDVWTKQNVAKELWDKFEDKKTKPIKAMEESVEFGEGGLMVADLEELPEHLQDLVESMQERIFKDTQKYMNEATFEVLRNSPINPVVLDIIGGYTTESSDIGYTVIRKRRDGIFEGSIVVTPEPSISVGKLMGRCPMRVYNEMTDSIDLLYNTIWESASEEFCENNPTKELMVSGTKPNLYFEFQITSAYAEKLWEYLESSVSDDTKTKRYPKTKQEKQEKQSIGKTYVEHMKRRILFDPFTEANNPAPEYNVDMTEAEAKKALRVLSQSTMDSVKKKKDYKVTQYTANIYANIITKNLLPIWAKGYRKFSITLDSYQSFHTFEFKIPNMTQDFVARFIEGRESINGLLHRTPEIRVRMSPRIFHEMQNPDDAYNFFKAAIKYYDSGITRYSEKMMAEVMKLNRELKHLIATTKLSGIVTCPMQLLFVFDDVKMDNKETFKISQSDIKTVNQFIKNIYTRYAAPEKEKKQIVDDMNKMVQSLKECCEYSENIKDIIALPGVLTEYFNGEFDSQMQAYKENVLYENLDMEWCNKNPNPQIRYLQEKFGVKKLKKIPRDLVAYITIETESIKDANDKMMIASYCLSKIEIVEWYIELLEVGSKKYVVPHTKPYLESVRTQLLHCYDNIMKVKIKPPSERPIIDVKYPAGYEG